MILLALTILAFLGSTMLMSMMEMSTPAWVRVAAVVKRNH